MHQVNASSCSVLNLTLGDNGVCFSDTLPYGIWNETLAKENDISAMPPTTEYMKYAMKFFNFYVCKVVLFQIGNGSALCIKS